MLDRDVLRLMNQELDGANGPEESRRLREILEKSNEAREYFDQLNAANALVCRDPAIDSGPDFQERVMRDLRRNTAEDHAEKETNSMTKKQKGFFIAAAVVTAAVAVILFINPGWLTNKAGKDEMAGTIAKADRYRPGGVTAKDVVLKKADVVKILQDPNFQNLIRNIRFQKLVQDPQFVELMKSDTAGATRLLGDPQAAKSFEAVAQLLAKPYVGYDIGFASLAGNAGFIGFLNDPNFAKAAGELASSGNLSEIVKSAAFFELLKNPKYSPFLLNPEFKALVKNAGFINFVGNDAKFASVKRRIEFAGLWDAVIEAQMSGNFAKLESSPGYQQAVMDPSFTSFLKSPEIASLHKDAFFLKAIEMDRFPELVGILYSANIFFDGGTSFAALVNSSAFSELLMSLELLSPDDRSAFCEVLADANFNALMGDANFRTVCQNPKFADFVKALATAGAQTDGLYVPTEPDDPGFAALSKNIFFYALVQNPSFQKVAGTIWFKNTQIDGPGFRTLLNSSYFSSLSNLGPYLAYSAPQFSELFKNIEFTNLLADKNFQGIFLNPSFKKIIWNAESLSALSRFLATGGQNMIEIDGPGFADLRNNAQFKALLAKPEYGIIWNNPAFSRFLANANTEALMKTDKIVICAVCFTNLVSNQNLASLLHSNLYSAAITLSDPGFAEMAKSMDAMKMYCTICFSNFVGLVQDPRLVSLIKNGYFYSLMNEPAFASLFFNGTMVAIFANPNYVGMLNTAMAPFLAVPGILYAR